MDLQEHELDSKNIQIEIDEKSKFLADKVISLISKRKNDIVALNLDDKFNFIDRNGNLMNIVDDDKIEIFSINNLSFYYSVFEGAIVTLEYQNDLDMNFSNDVTDKLELLISTKPSIYLDLMHLIGLDGILQCDLSLKKNILEELTNYD